MSDAAAIEKPSGVIGRIAEMIEKRKTAQQAIIDGRYQDIPEIETEGERFNRLMETPEAWDG
jgi:hypothetical protein